MCHFQRQKFTEVGVGNRLNVSIDMLTLIFTHRLVKSMYYPALPSRPSSIWWRRRSYNNRTWIRHKRHTATI